MLVFEKEKYKEYSSKTFRPPNEIINKLEEIAKGNNVSVDRIEIQYLEYAISEASTCDPPSN